MKKLTKQQLLDLLLKEVSELVPAGAGYHYQIEYNSIYGGYRLIKVNDANGGHSGAFGGNGCEARIKFAAMEMKLRTIIATASQTQGK